MKKFKLPKWALITLAVADVGITMFLFVVHIIMLSSFVGKTDAEISILKMRTDLIGTLANNTNLYLGLFVIPLFVILAINIIILVVYIKKSTAKAPVKVSDLSDEQKAALRKELLKELENEDK